MRSLTRPNYFTYLLSAIAFLFALYLFQPFKYFFLNDDLIHIPLSKAGELFQRRSFRPIGDLSVQLDHFLWGKKAWGYHLTNLLLHLSNTVLVFFLSRALLKKYAANTNVFEQSLLASVLFFVYAFHSESIFWILGRSGSLATLFFIPAFIFYLKRHEKRSCFLLSLIFFELSLLAYESAWIFPLIVVVIAVADRRLFKSSLKKEAAFFALVVVLFCAHLYIRYKVIGEVAGGYEAAGFMQLDVGKLAMNFVKLVGRSILPPVSESATFVVCFALLMFFVMLICWMIKRQKSRGLNKGSILLSLLTVLFIISVLPYLSLGIDTHGVEGERYLYMPSIFCCLLIVIVLDNYCPRRFVPAAWAFLLLLNLVFLSRSASYYRTAGNISQITFKQMNLLQGKQRLFIDSLPQSYKGALIFRLGFDEGVQWLKEEGSVANVVILSLKKDNLNWSEDYQFETITNKPTATISEMLVRDATQRQTYIPLRISPITFNPETDAWFIFKDGGLEIIK